MVKSGESAEDACPCTDDHNDDVKNMTQETLPSVKQDYVPELSDNGNEMLSVETTGDNYINQIPQDRHQMDSTCEERIRPNVCEGGPTHLEDSRNMDLSGVRNIADYNETITNSSPPVHDDQQHCIETEIAKAGFCYNPSFAEQHLICKQVTATDDTSLNNDVPEYSQYNMMSTEVTYTFQSTLCEDDSCGEIQQIIGSDTRQLVFDLCGGSFEETTNEKSKSPPGENVPKCEICNKTFTRKASKKIHMRLHTGENLFKCEICDKAFIQKRSLDLHLVAHTGEKPFKCDICEKKFTRKSTQEAHQRIHTGENLFKCHICNKPFLLKSSLELHVKAHAGERPFKCDMCDKSFTRKSSLELHLQIHTGEKPFKCDICDKTFYRKTSLELHSTSHSGERPFECSICNKTFVRLSSLESHLTVHSGEKPFKCDTCNKQFKWRSCFDLHLMIHRGEKPFECAICKKSFNQKYYLKQHMRVHSGQKPFKCDKCPKQFFCKSPLKVHTKTL